MARALFYIFLIYFSIAASASSSTEDRIHKLIVKPDHRGYAVSPEASPLQYREMKLSWIGNTIEISIADRAQITSIKLPISSGMLLSEDLGFDESRLIDIIEWDLPLTIVLDGVSITTDKIVMDIKDDELIAAEESHFPPETMPPGHRIIIAGYKKGERSPMWQGALYTDIQLGKGYLDQAITMMKNDNTVFIPLVRNLAVERIAEKIRRFTSPNCDELLK